MPLLTRSRHWNISMLLLTRSIGNKRLEENRKKPPYGGLVRLVIHTPNTPPYNSTCGRERPGESGPTVAVPKGIPNTHTPTLQLRPLGEEDLTAVTTEGMSGEGVSILMHTPFRKMPQDLETTFTGRAG